jgi:metal-responsive CopG/Arc/MetJ family transcriptional regulator
MWIMILIDIHITRRKRQMRTVQMTLDDDLVEEVDEIAKKLQTTRSAFTREALRNAIAQYHITDLEQKHREGYEAHPTTESEFGVWEEEQDWGDQ